jgi:hypothetical protein
MFKCQLEGLEKLHTQESKKAPNDEADVFFETQQQVAVQLDAIIDRTTKRGTWLSTRAKRLSEIVWHDCYGGRCAAYLYKKCVDFVRSENLLRI